MSVHGSLVSSQLVPWTWKDNSPNQLLYFLLRAYNQGYILCSLSCKALSEKVLTSLGSCLFKKVIKKIICYTNKKGSEFKLMTKLYIFFKLFSTKIKILFIRSSPKKCCFESNPNLRFVCHHWTCKVIVLLCICQGSISTLALWTNQLTRELTTP